MAIINMHEAKTQLSDLVARAEAGEEIVIARRNKPTVRLVPVGAGLRGAQPGGFAEDGQADYDVGAMRAAVKAGREFLIMQDGKPVAKLVPVGEKRVRGFGMLAHLPPGRTNSSPLPCRKQSCAPGRATQRSIRAGRSLDAAL